MQAERSALSIKPTVLRDSAARVAKPPKSTLTKEQRSTFKKNPL
jgi:hypothetical protein